MEKARKEQKSAEEAESKGLLRQVIADWPFVPIEPKRCFAADIHEATALEGRPPAKEEEWEDAASDFAYDANREREAMKRTYRD